MIDEKDFTMDKVNDYTVDENANSEKEKEKNNKRAKKMSAIIKVLPNCKSIKEIEEATGIPRSTVQRYLKDENNYILLTKIGELKLDEVKEMMKFVEVWLERSKMMGHSRGGIKSQQNFGYSKDANGKFSGHTR